MMRRILLFAVCAALLSACSPRQVYSGLQVRERNLCAEGPPTLYEECMARVAMSYEEYRARDSH